MMMMDRHDAPPPAPSAADAQAVPTLEPKRTVADSTPENGYELYSDTRTELYNQSQAYGREEQQ